MNRPDSFLTVRHQITFIEPTLNVLCAGYENGKWRSLQFANHLVEWIPEFALDEADIKALGVHNAVYLIKKAAQLVYQTTDFKDRGEIGEILLHAAIRQLFCTIPVISKIYFKDGPNDTVKGFDCVHAVETTEGLELWLGEVKFYTSIDDAMTKVTAEIIAHSTRNYLRNEFIAIVNKINDKSKHKEAISKLLHPNTSLDDIFESITIPVLLTYESETLRAHSKVVDQFKTDIIEETNKYLAAFKKRVSKHNINFKIHLILVPLHTKDDLVCAFDTKLKGLQ